MKNSSPTRSKIPTSRGPIRKYRSGSTSALHVKTGGSGNSGEGGGEKSGDKGEDKARRPATQSDLLYAVESDESTIVDSLIKDPQKLKDKLRQSRVDREQLNQLQQNYLRLLEQYAEAENFIDMFRLSGQGVISVTPNTNMFQVLVFTIYFEFNLFLNCYFQKFEENF